MKFNVRAAVRVVAVTALATWTAVASAGIAGSHHDFSRATWARQELCVVCHTPHHANMTVPQSPLWNHEVTSALFTTYASQTMDASPGQPGGPTKLCLSCHDGTVARDSYGGQSGTRMISSSALVGTNLSKHHPVSIVYDSALAVADGNLRDPATTDSGLGGTIEQKMLRGGRLECVSCHDVHVGRNTRGCVGCHSMHGGGNYRLETLSLRKSNSASTLCLTCHIK